MVESRNKFFINNFMINKADKPSMADLFWILCMIVGSSWEDNGRCSTTIVPKNFLSQCYYWDYKGIPMLRTIQIFCTWFGLYLVWNYFSYIITCEKQKQTKKHLSLLSSQYAINFRRQKHTKYPITTSNFMHCFFFFFEK